MSEYVVTGQYRQEIVATVDAESNDEAVLKAMALFEEWLERMDEEVEGISFLPEGATLDDEALVTQLRTPTEDDRSCWTGPVELSMYETQAKQGK